MFFHILKYRMKCLLKDKETVFWTLGFPIVLALFFNLSLSGIGENETFHAVPVAVVNDEQYQKDEIFQSVLKEVSTGENPLLSLSEVSLEEAEDMLRNNKIAGYLSSGSPVKLTVRQSGLNQSILQSFVDYYVRNMSTASSILKINPGALDSLMKDMGNQAGYIKEVSATKADPDNILSYFYALIAMSCFYGGLQGARDVSDIQADNTDTAARLNLAPVHKMKTFLTFMGASLLIHFVKMLLLLLFLRFAIQVDFGDKVGPVVLTTLVGSVVGLSFGAFVSALLKKAEGVKIAIVIGVTMFLSFLSGMMYQGMKYIVRQNYPLLSQVNPLNLLTDAYYSLYYYDTYTRYTENMLYLAVFIPIFWFGIYLIVRRRKYANL